MSEDPLIPESPTFVDVQPESPSHGEGPSSDGPPRPHRRRRRRPRRGGRGAGSNGGGGGAAAVDRAEDFSATGPERPVEGVLYVPPKENAAGVLVSARANFLPSPKDPLVPRELINR